MFKNLNCELLGISGRQSEVIELALTYGFRGIDIDISDMVKRCQRGSFESAARFLISSKLQVSGFQAPVDLDGDEDTYATQAALLNGAAEIAHRAGATYAVLQVPSETDRLPYPEYFEVIRTRIEEVVAIFAKEETKVALEFLPKKDSELEKQFKFVRDVEGFVVLANSCKSAGIVFDSWSWFVGGGTEAHLEQIGVERILTARICDCVEGVSAENATVEDCLLPGSTGVIDNITFLKKLAAAGLEIPIAAKGRLLTPGGTRDSFIGKTQDALHACFEEAGIPSQTRKPENFVAPSYASSTS